MEIIDRNFRKLPIRRKVFLFIIGTGFFLIGLLGYIFNLITIFECLIFIIIGAIYTEIIKLSYRIEKTEKKKK